ncbi:Proteinaceous rnase p [Thalictrum thalictroides]|uniref:ribonuclease P n=1 Tax=Thalictrum thalictroides TaxID=46969 RepID=A0A7J6VH68_THATH|nr:Proteinaceous rnase p [Thalictrum thalictroides]
MSQKHYLCTSTASATSPNRNSSTTNVRTPSKRVQRKKHRQSPEGQLRHKLDMCSKDGDLVEALRIYDDARSNKLSLSKHHYNVLLYLCSSSDVLVHEINEKSMNLGLRRGFEIFKQMGIDGIAPDEATFTNASRLAAKLEDPEMAFDLLKKMMNSNIPPKLRSYEPALFGFCSKGEADKAYEVDAHMLASGVSPEEPQLAALLQVSVNVKNADKVYEIIHRLRASVRQVSDSTAKIIEEWFNSKEAMEVGKVSWDVNKVKEGIVKRGGGWHGQGWLGKGEWKVVKTEVDEKGVCHCCAERLVCIDIDPLETENFANLLYSLACQRDAKANFNHFQDWLKHNGPFDAVIDGANVSLNNGHTFSFFQLNAVVERVRELSPTKRLPLIILHTGRVVGGPANSPRNKTLIEQWRRSGALYIAPKGSNDDWYWLYAAVSGKSLLVTNDEMRDHLFQLLGTSFFPRWKEKHQVRYKLSRDGTVLQLPPPYSIVIQESERGGWHIPMVSADDVDMPRQWVCASRASTSLNSAIS